MSPNKVEHHETFPPGITHPQNPERFEIYAAGGVIHTGQSGQIYELGGFFELGAMPRELWYYGKKFTNEEADKHLADMIAYINAHPDIFFPARSFP